MPTFIYLAVGFISLIYSLIFWYKNSCPSRPEPNETVFEYLTFIFSRYIKIHNNYTESSFLLLQKALYT